MSERADIIFNGLVADQDAKPRKRSFGNSVRRASRRSPVGANPTWPIGRSAGSNQGDEGPGSEYQNSLTRETVNN